MSMTIARLADQANVGVETVRYYQRRGLLGVPARPHGSVRRYGSDDLRQLRFIRAAQSAGFTLEEIRELLELDSSGDRARAREIAMQRIDLLDLKIANLERARLALSNLAKACVTGSEGPCPILAAFDS